MKIYKVGGAVRDELLGLVPRDHDFLVIDSTPDEMKRKGFIQVGVSYDVFLHPETKDEYVLATDLKLDLERRDLTINSMARDNEGNLLDFFNGKADLEKKILRHTSPHFSDDLLRVYRVARFTAQYPDFSITPETLELCRKLSQKEDFKNLNGERILGEFKDALSAKNPENFFNTLKLFNSIDTHFDCVREWHGLNLLSGKGLEPLYLFSYLMRKNTKLEIDNLAGRLLIQNDWIEAARVASRVYAIPSIEKMKAEDYIELFYAIDAFRKPHLIKIISTLFEDRGYVFKKYFEMVNQISIRDIDSEFSGKEIGEAIRKLRIKKLNEVL